MSSAAELVAEIGSRFRRGDSADDLLATLTRQVADVTRLAAEVGPDLPEDVRKEIAALVALLQTVAAGGEEWLADVGPELAAPQQTWRVRQAYGFPTRPG